MKKIKHIQTLAFYFCTLVQKLNVQKLTTFIVVAFFSLIHFQAQSQNITADDSNGKISIRQNFGANAKTKTKSNIDLFTSLKSYASSNNTSICSPESSLIITEDSSWGISRSTINNSGLPSFCLRLPDEAPKENDIFNTTLTPSADINFNNGNLTNAQIIDKVRRTVSVMHHVNYAPSSAPSSLFSDFYKAIAVTIWHYTDNLNTSNYNYTWTAANGNSYSVNNLIQWVNNGTLQAADAIWLIPENSSRQPEVLLNTNTSSNCCPIPPSITTTTITPTSSNNGQIKINSVSGAQYYGISSLNAGNYNGATTIATATQIPNTLPTTILSNAPQNGGTYIVRVFTNIDGCFTDYTVTVPDSGLSCTSTYAEFQSENGVDNEYNAEGAPDGSVANIHSNDDQLVLDFGQVFPSGTEYNITWRKRSGENGTAIIDLSESTSANSGFTNHPTSPQTATTGSFTTTTVTANSNFRYLAFDKGNSSTTDYEIDAVEVIVCVSCDVADNTTANASITENETKTLTGTPAGGTFS
ncbi:hypothetical protein, partial [Polaribacter sp.]|uniref:hypothetical protein n=1 Tax=Polaribacter sp. TaxID=1920175 RepID=UPI003F6D068E